MSINKSTVIASLTAIFLTSTSAIAADLRNSVKDVTITQSEDKFVNRSGFYVNGALGYGFTDRNVDGDIFGQKLYDDKDKDGKPLPQVPGTFHTLDFGGSDDSSGLIYGAGLSYLFHMPSKRFAIEVGLDGTLYNNNETTVGFSGHPHDFQPNGDPATYNDGFSGDTHAGVYKFERDFDIDLVLKGHLFVTNDWSLYAGVGASWARASAKGGHENQSGNYANSFDDTDDAVGLVLAAGTTYWLNDRTSLSLDYNYKQHEFDFGSSSSVHSASLPGGDGHPASGPGDRVSSDNLKVEDDTHIVKAKIGFKLN